MHEVKLSKTVGGYAEAPDTSQKRRDKTVAISLFLCGDMSLRQEFVDYLQDIITA